MLNFFKTPAGLVVLSFFNTLILNRIIPIDMQQVWIYFFINALGIALYTLFIYRDKMSASFKLKVSLYSCIIAAMFGLLSGVDLRSIHGGLLIFVDDALLYYLLLQPIFIVCQYASISLGNWLGLLFMKLSNRTK